MPESSLDEKDAKIREPIEVRVLPDEINVASYPGLDRSVSIKELRSSRFDNDCVTDSQKCQQKCQQNSLVESKMELKKVGWSYP